MSRLTTVRYGSLRLRGLFTVETGEEIQAGDSCLVRSARGTEVGIILAKPIEDSKAVERGPEGGGSGGSASASGSAAGSSEKAPADKIGCGESACGSCATPQGSVLRRASPDEVKRHTELKKQGVRDEVRFAREKSREYRLGMKIVGAEYLFEREKLIVHFSTVGRVEFHHLVRDLGQRFKTRIELKQIGARDEARLTGDVASCGRELCCRSFLHDLQPVSMRMAKQQKKTLDPTKIAGQCGKLKCCLRYEDSVYVELQKTLPRRGSFVRIEEGIGRVVNVDLLLQKLVLEAENGERKIVHVSQVLESGLKPPRPLPPPDSGDTSDRGPNDGPRVIAPAQVPPSGGTDLGPPPASKSPPKPPPADEDDDGGQGDPSLEN